MSKNKVTEIVENLARPIVEDLGLELVDVEYVRESANWYLRVFIDKDGGVTLDDCEAVNGPLGEKLDEVDPIPQSYIFEVSSPGVERPFKRPEDYKRAIGHMVRIKFYKSIDGRKKIEGILEAYDNENGTVSISTENSEIKTYSLNDISKINRMILL
ncbi:MAG: ribosome maturation factor RimP [Clostridiaceae bacterium]|jgi:ribosome maturation factor RimP|nr:ribosome maturation factor RimP [Clostridiaceae bacterium]